MVYGDEFLDGLALCLEYYRRLEELDPDHELLVFGDVKPTDKECFYIVEGRRSEFNQRFAKDGVHPKGHQACAYAVAHYAGELKGAIDAIEGRDIEEGELVGHVSDSEVLDDDDLDRIPF
jgi:hypothetical protein